MIPVIDVFAGPGGLGEGFSQLKVDGKPVFDIKLSLEKEENAHKTLTWRSFYRQFKKNNLKLPQEYYQAYQATSLKERERIIEGALSSTFEGQLAMHEAKLVELGASEWPPERVDELIINALGPNVNEWVLIGGPPCQAYSNVGRSRVGGIDPKDHRVYLYEEYLRIVEKHRPVAFVMENVQGLLSAKVNGESVFDRILEDLSLNGKYQIHSFVCEPQKPSDYLISTDKFGVPQTRKRVILFGLLEGMKHNDEYLKPSKPVTLQDALQGLPKVRSGIGKVEKGGTRLNVRDSKVLWQSCIQDSISLLEPKFGSTMSELDFEATGLSGIGSEYVPCKRGVPGFSVELKKWYGVDRRLKGVANFQSRTHLDKDLTRYLYAALVAGSEGRSPLLHEMVESVPQLSPAHQSASRGVFKDRFKCQRWNAPASTVTSHISKDGHYFIHPDPAQCRSLVVREAARIQTFPDDYLFRGSRTAQFRQVGNAVPPLLAHKIASVVHNNIK